MLLLYGLVSKKLSKTCYLHLGFHKTATSSFQETCASNSALLKDSFGLTYPTFICSANGKKVNNHSIPIFSMYCDHPSRYHVNVRWGVGNKIDEVNASYKKQFVQSLERSESLVISGEGIALLPPENLNRLLGDIRQYGYDINALAVVRSPYSSLCSEIQQTIKMGKYIRLISLNGSGQIPRDFKIARVTDRIKKAKSIFHQHIKFFGFDRACSHEFGPVGYLVQNFLEKDPGLFEYTKANESLFDLTVRMQNELNKVNSAIVNGKHNPLFQKLDSSVNRNFAFSGKFLLTEKEYGLVKDQVELESEGINDLLGHDFQDRSIQFADSIF